MANAIIKRKEKYRLDVDFQNKVIEVLIKRFKLPVPRWVFVGKKNIVIIVDESVCGLYIGKRGSKVEEIGMVLGKPVRVICVSKDQDGLSLL